MVNIDYRKLIGFSNGSFVVTMPKSWIGKNNLKKGDMIGIEENSTNIIFHANTKEVKKEDKSIVINADDKNLVKIKAEIVVAYLNNYNTIEIFSNNLENNALAIKDILRNLSGMEIIEQTGSRIVAKDLIDVGNISVQSLIRRMDVITRSMMDDTILCIEGKCNPKSIGHRDVDVNRLYYLGFRIIKNIMENPALMKKLNTDPWRLFSDKMVLTRIEEIADRQKRISRLIAEIDYKNKLIKDFKKLKEEIKQRYSDAMKAYYNNDKTIAYNIETTNKALIEVCDKFLEDMSISTCAQCHSQLLKLNSRLEMKKGNQSNPETFQSMNTSIAKIVEYTKATLTFIKYIARTVLSM
ncbi:phosphate uptake regulator PhoU [Candidatus Woesearchaeota archaeon]|nr:phosphate uptake regulator PhoU [Candidatus Woesearchaeota archaeon]